LCTPFAALSVVPLTGLLDDLFSSLGSCETMEPKEDAMRASSLPGQAGRYHPVVVRAGPAGRFTAQSAVVPEIRAEGETVEAALEQAQAALAAWPGALFWVPVATSTAATHPALPWVGHAKADPDFDLYLDEIRRAREQADQRECPASSSTPTT
jgi:hypothetical protein